MSIISNFKRIVYRSMGYKFYPNVHPSAVLAKSVRVFNPNNLIMGANTNIYNDSIIMNPRAKFIMGNYSGAAEQLLVITGNHMSIPGMNLKQVTDDVKDLFDKNKEMDRDVIVDEDVWIGARVTILSGVHIGRGCEIGSGCVLRNSVPPYAIVVGNPAKIVGFRFTPEEIIEHELKQYSDIDRLPKDMLDKNYEKFFLSRIAEIKKSMSIIC